MKKILSILLGIIFCFSFTGCELSFDKDGGEIVTNLTQLPTPTNIEVYDDYVYWDEVPNASSYVIKINDIQESVGNSLKYSIAAIMDGRLESNIPTELHIYIKAKGNQVLYSDSNWSNEYLYTYTKMSNEPISEKLVDKEAVDKAKELRIGYGYNFIDDVYFDVTNASYNSVIDLDKLFIDSSLSAQSSEYTKTDKIYEESITDFHTRVSTALTSEVSVGGAIGIYSANVSAGLKSSSAIEFSKYAKSGFLNCYSYSEYKNYQVLDFGNSFDLSNILSSNFLSIVNKEGIYASLTNDALAEYIINYYGTHLIMGVTTGGRLDYYYSFATNNLSAAADFKREITANASGEIAGIISASTNNSISTELSASISNNETENKSNFEIYGGSSEGISEANIGEKFVSWSASINETNARSIGVPKNGLIYLPTLISYLNKDLGVAVDSFINQKANDAYNELVSKFKNNDISDKEDGTMGNPYKISTPAQLFQYLDGNEEGVYYKLINNIDLTGYDWEPIENFKGILDGNKYKIMNLFVERVGTLNDSTVHTGFIQVNEGTIKNLIFDNVKLDVNYQYDSSAERRLRGGIVGLNNGKISNIQVINSNFDLTIIEEKSASGHDVNPVLDLGTIAGWNCGEIEFCKVESTTLKGKSNAESNYGQTYSVVGGLVGTNKANISNSISTNLNISSEARGGYYKFLTGGGWVKSWVGYITGNNEKNVQNCISYNHAENSLQSKANDIADYMGTENYRGLASGKNSGAFEDVYVISMDSVTNFIGNNGSSYKENIKSNESQIVNIMSLWANWSYEEGEFKVNS